MKMAKGYVGGRGRLYRSARETVERALAFAYRDRRVKLSYSQLIKGLKQARVEIDRKVLAEIAVADMDGFSQLAQRAKSSLDA